MAEPARHHAPGDQMISVGRICGFQGRRGEVAVEIRTDFPDRFKAGAGFRLARHHDRPPNDREYIVEEAWFHKGQVILKFAGIDSISEAEALTGLELMIARSERRELTAGSFYLDDLVGCRIVEAGQGIGTVLDWEDTGGGILLHVKDGGAQGEILVPFASEICTEIDLAGRVIRVRLPEGLRDLNGAEPGRKRRK